MREFTDSLNNSTTLIDYFITIGVSDSRMEQLLQLWREGRYADLESVELEPEIITKVPRQDKASFPIDNIIKIFPLFGFDQRKFALQRDERPPELKNFTALIYEKDKHVYVTSLVFYERLEDLETASMQQRGLVKDGSTFYLGTNVPVL